MPLVLRTSEDALMMVPKKKSKRSVKKRSVGTMCSVYQVGGGPLHHLQKLNNDLQRGIEELTYISRQNPYYYEPYMFDDELFITD